MQEGGSASGHAGNEYRPLDSVRPGHTAPNVRQREPRFQDTPKVHPREEVTELMQISLALDAINQDRKSRLDGRITKVVETCPAPGLRAQHVTIQREKATAWPGV
jgi:hypothetical protein